MNNPNDNNKSSDGNFGKKTPSVAAGKKRDMAKKLGAGYKPGTTQGDLMKHKAENFRVRLGK